MARRTVDVAVIIPDASPVLTLARTGRIDLLGSFTVPVRIVDQVNYEIRKPENDPKGEVAAALAKLHNQIEVWKPMSVSAIRPAAPATRRNQAATSARLPWISTQPIGAAHRARIHPAGPVRKPGRVAIARRPLRGVHMLNTTAWLPTHLRSAYGFGDWKRVDPR